MKYLATIVGVLLVLSIVLAEVPTLFALTFPEEAAKIVNPWWQRSVAARMNWELYSYPVYQSWYVKFITNEVADIITLFVLAKAAIQFSWKLAKIAWIFLGYQVVDLLCLLWNFKTGYFIYVVMNVAIIWAVIRLFRKEKQTAIVKSLQ